MQDEIKEILDNLKYTAKKHTIQVLENGGKIEHCPQEIETELRLNTYSANILLDYITNLQEENKDLKDDLEVIDKSACFWEDTSDNYKSKNEKAIEYIKNDWYELNTRDIEHCINLNKDIRIDLLNILEKGE